MQEPVYFQRPRSLVAALVSVQCRWMEEVGVLAAKHGPCPPVMSHVAVKTLVLFRQMSVRIRARTRLVALVPGPPATSRAAVKKLVLFHQMSVRMRAKTRLSALATVTFAEIKPVVLMKLHRQIAAEVGVGLWASVTLTSESCQAVSVLIQPEIVMVWMRCY